jgi:hypothetical protein
MVLVLACYPVVMEIEVRRDFPDGAAEFHWCEFVRRCDEIEITGREVLHNGWLWTAIPPGGSITLSHAN